MERPRAVRSACGRPRSGWGNWPRAVGRCAFVTKEKGLMRRISCWGVGLVAAVWLLTAGGASAQDDMPFGYAPPPYTLPVPLYSTRPEDGGFFAAASYVQYRWNSPLKSQ